MIFPPTASTGLPFWACVYCAHCVRIAHACVCECSRLGSRICACASMHVLRHEWGHIYIYIYISKYIGLFKRGGGLLVCISIFWVFRLAIREFSPPFPESRRSPLHCCQNSCSYNNNKMVGVTYGRQINFIFCFVY